MRGLLFVFIHLKCFFYPTKLNLFNNFSLLLDINFELNIDFGA